MKNVILYDLWDNGQSRPGEHLLSEIGHSYTWRLGFNGTPAGRSNATAEKVTMGRYQENFERLDHHRISDLIGKHNTHREQLTKYINAVEKSQQNTKDDKSRQAKMTKSVEQKQQAEGKTYDGEMEVATAYRKLGRQHNLDCDLLADAHELSAAARNLKDLVDALRGLANLGLEEEEL